MKVILLKDIPRFGRKNEVKEVSDGHARNFLFPRGLAQEASAARVKHAEAMRVESLEAQKLQHELLLKNLESLKSVRVTVAGKANGQGHLFKGIHAEELLAALKEQAHIELMPEHVTLPHPLKEVGEHIVAVSVGGKNASFTAIVEAA